MRNKLIFAALLLAPLSACAGLSSITVSQVADETRASADAAYITALKAGQLAVTLGKLTPDAYKVDAAQGYAVLLQVRAGTATLAALTTALAPLSGAQ
jgi:hypothetical protein